MSKILTIKKLSNQIFKYLLPNETLIKEEAIDPINIARLADNYYISDSEGLTIWFYARLIAKCADVEQKRMQSIGSALRITKAFDDVVVAYIAENKLEDKISINDILTEIPNALISDITKTIVRFMQENLSKKEDLLNLNALIYQHSTDRTCINAVKAVPGLGGMITKLVDFMKRTEEIRLLSSAIEITEDSMPDVYNTYLEVCKRLDVKNIPPLYLEQGSINAYTTGVDEPYIVINSMTVTLLNKSELSFILGHELGHILCGHVKYQTLARVLKSGVSTGVFAIPVLGKILAGVSEATLGTALFAWSRRSEYSADRAGLLACQDIDTAIRVSMKLAGLPPSHFGAVNQKSFIAQMMKYRNELDNSSFVR